MRPAADRGLEAREREVAIRPADHRPRKGKTGGIAVAGGRFDRRPAGIAEAQQAGGLVEGLAHRIVDGGAQAAILPEASTPGTPAPGWVPAPTK